MSIRVMSNVWDDAALEDRAELLVMLALADWANDRGECDPSYTQLARKARISRRYAIQVVERLVAKGLLRIDLGRGFNFSEWAASNRITLTQHAPPGEPRFTRASEPQFTTPVNPSSLGPVNPSSPTTVNNNGHQQQSTNNPHPPVVVVPPPAAPSQPVPADNDDGHGGELLAAVLEAMTGGTETVPAPYTMRRARGAVAKLARVAPSAGPAEVQAAAEDWTARMRRRRETFDPITADQLVEAVTAWLTSQRASRRRIVPFVER